MDVSSWKIEANHGECISLCARHKTSYITPLHKTDIEPAIDKAILNS
jgi:hypothetical protein